jgi:large subunit ribosomal protein L28
MFKKCVICGKGPVSGRNIVRKGLAKSKGGTGKKVVRVTRRNFLPNLQRMRILINNRPKRVYVCARCIKKGDIQKA